MRDCDETSSWLLSRKIRKNTVVNRHFARWKLRNFTVDRANYLLGIRSSDPSSFSIPSSNKSDKLTIIKLSASNLTIKHHYYLNEEKNCLSLCYMEHLSKIDSKTEWEIMIKFENIDNLNKWRNALLEVMKEHDLQELKSARNMSYKLRQWMQDNFLNKLNEAEDHEGRLLSPRYSLIGMTPILLEKEICRKLISTRQICIDSASKSPAVHSNVYNSYWKLKIPKMNIIIMAVGTRGDIEPFIQLGMRLKKDGHRIRLGTHENFRSFIMEKGLEFYPLAGDPMKLSEFMVKTRGLVTRLTTDILREVPKYHSMIVSIIHSTWAACTEKDPLDSTAKPFVADAIISNPVTYGHFHCAEALGIPLHLMFPQPWSPTKAFAHPLSGRSIDYGWSIENYFSYQLVDSIVWLSFETEINKFRTETLGLEPLHTGDRAWDAVNLRKIPFAKMWSPNLVPKPKDWPEHVDIVGSFFQNDLVKENNSNRIDENNPNMKSQILHSTENSMISIQDGEEDDDDDPFNERMSANNDASEHDRIPDEYIPSIELQNFVDENAVHSNKRIVYIGFGSMVISDLPKIVSIFLEAAARSNVKVMFQIGWSDLNPEAFKILAEEAENKARILREAEYMNSNMAASIIFPTYKKNQAIIKSRSMDEKAVMELNPSVKSNNLDQKSIKESPRHNVRSGSIGSWLFNSINLGGQLVSANSGNASQQESPDLNKKIVDETNTLDSLPKIKLINSNDDDIDNSWVVEDLSGVDEPLTTSRMLCEESLKSSHDEDNGLHSVNNAPQSRDSSNVSSSSTGWRAELDAILVPPCPHDWLFNHVNAVIHHGGAGTTAAGLRAGCPTWICPFFGDQFFWGEMVHRAGLGPRPCPIDKLLRGSVDRNQNMKSSESDGIDPIQIVVDGLETLFEDEVSHAADTMARQFKSENGIESAVECFYNHLPIENMLCDISLLLSKSKLAHVYCVDCGLKMSIEVSRRIHSALSENNHSCSSSQLISQASENVTRADVNHSQRQLGHTIIPCHYINWEKRSQKPPVNVTDGIVKGMGGLLYELSAGISDALSDPLRGIYNDGMYGALSGLVSGINSLLTKRPIVGGSILIRNVKTSLLPRKPEEDAVNDSYSPKNLPSDEVRVNESRDLLRVCDETTSVRSFSGNSTRGEDQFHNDEHSTNPSEYPAVKGAQKRTDTRETIRSKIMHTRVRHAEWAALLAEHHLECNFHGSDPNTFDNEIDQRSLQSSLKNNEAIIAAPPMDLELKHDSGHTNSEPINSFPSMLPPSNSIEPNPVLVDIFGSKYLDNTSTTVNQQSQDENPSNSNWMDRDLIEFHPPIEVTEIFSVDPVLPGSYQINSEVIFDPFELNPSPVQNEFADNDGDGDDAYSLRIENNGDEFPFIVNDYNLSRIDKETTNLSDSQILLDSTKSAVGIIDNVLVDDDQRRSDEPSAYSTKQQYMAAYIIALEIIQLLKDLGSSNGRTLGLSALVRMLDSAFDQQANLPFQKFHESRGLIENEDEVSVVIDRSSPVPSISSSRSQSHEVDNMDALNVKMNLYEPERQAQDDEDGDSREDPLADTCESSDDRQQQARLLLKFMTKNRQYLDFVDMVLLYKDMLNCTN